MANRIEKRCPFTHPAETEQHIWSHISGHLTKQTTKPKQWAKSRWNATYTREELQRRLIFLCGFIITAITLRIWNNNLIHCYYEIIDYCSFKECILAHQWWDFFSLLIVYLVSCGGWRIYIFYCVEKYFKNHIKICEKIICTFNQNCAQKNNFLFAKQYLSFCEWRIHLSFVQKAKGSELCLAQQSLLFVRRHSFQHHNCLYTQLTRFEGKH